MADLPPGFLGSDANFNALQDSLEKGVPASDPFQNIPGLSQSLPNPNAATANGPNFNPLQNLQPWSLNPSTPSPNTSDPFQHIPQLRGIFAPSNNGPNPLGQFDQGQIQDMYNNQTNAGYNTSQSDAIYRALLRGKGIPIAPGNFNGS